MKGEKITNLYDLIQAIVTKQKILDEDGDARRLKDYTIIQLQTELEEGLYIKKEPEPPKCPYCLSITRKQLAFDNGYYCECLNADCRAGGPVRDTFEEAADALKSRKEI